MKSLQRQEVFTLTPTSLQEAMKFAEIISKSDLVPRDYKDKAGNVLVAVQMGAELGLKPLQALQNIAIINGRPSVWGDALLGIIQAHPECEYVHEEITNEKAICKVKRKGRPEVMRTFDKSEAATAGLLKKPGVWQQYPKRMMQMRARAFALRDAFADALKGIFVAEEVQDYQEPKIVTQEEKIDKLASLLEEPKQEPANNQDNNEKVEALEELYHLIDDPRTDKKNIDIILKRANVKELLELNLEQIKQSSKWLKIKIDEIDINNIPGYDDETGEIKQ